MYFDNVSHKRKQTELEDERKLSKKSLLEAEIKMEVAENDSNQVSRDPFQLPDPCVANILKYLSGKELLDVMEVCKHWKNTIEGRRAIMNRAMDEVVALFNDEDFKFVGNIGSCVPSKRAFKHVRCYYPSYFVPFNSTRLLPLALIYAKSLVSLEIECQCPLSSETDPNDMKFLQPVAFPNLKSFTLFNKTWHECYGSENGFEDYCMKLHRKLVRFLKSCSFPEVTKLFLNFLREYECSDDEFDFNLAFTEIVCNMPKLKALSCNMMSVNTVVKPERLPQLEILVTAYYDISVHFKQLKELYIENYCSCDVCHDILSSCKQLRVLQIGGFGIVQENNLNAILQFPRHKNMEKFILAEYDDTSDNDKEKLQKVLSALPNLKVLILYCELKTFDILKFLALNMVKLEKLICKQLSTPSTPLQYFSTLCKENRFANVTIKVEEDPNCCEFNINFREKFNEFKV